MIEVKMYVMSTRVRACVRVFTQAAIIVQR